jgi:hypothetical protein
VFRRRPLRHDDGVNQVSVALATRTALMRRSTRIIAPYNTLEYQPWFPMFRLVLIAAMAMIVVYATTLTTMGGTSLLKVAAIPIGVVLGVVIWLLPDADEHAPPTTADPPYIALLVAFVSGIIVWPSYIAIVIPGLPWLTPPRLILAGMIAMMLIHYPQHRHSRGTLIEVMSHDRIAISLFLLYESLNILVLPLSPKISDTVSFLVLQEVMNLSAVTMAGVLLTKPNNIRIIYAGIVVTAIYAMLVCIVENDMQIPPWADYIPSFMQIDQSFLSRILSPQARIGDNRYRIRSTFPVVLYFTQYLSLVLPLVLYAAWRMRGRYRILGLALVPLVLHTVWYANARTAISALLIPLFVFAALSLWRSLRQGRNSDALRTGIRAAVIMLLVGMLGGVLATSHRAQMYTFGGKQHAGSNDARDRQWANAWKQLAKNPIGIGAGNSVARVGIAVKGRDNLIVDSLYINLLVDVGYLGFFAFFGMFIRCAWLGITCFMRAVNEIEEQAGAAAIGLISYVTTCSVVSTTDSGYLSFLLCGMIVATKRLQDQRIAEEARLSNLPAPTSALAVRRG